MKYLGATHRFEKGDKRYTVELRPDGTTLVNGKEVCKFQRPNTTKTRAELALKYYLQVESERKFFHAYTNEQPQPTH